MAAITSRRPIAHVNPLLVIERILRDPEQLWQEVYEERGLAELIQQMVTSSALSFATYGLIMGFSNGPLQALSSAVKLPLLFLLTLAICLPALYLFNMVFGGRMSVRQALSSVLVAITVTALLSLAFAPISLFFTLTAHNNYNFIKLINVSLLTLTGMIGTSYLVSGIQRINALAVLPPPPVPTFFREDDAELPPPPPPLPVRKAETNTSMLLLTIWLAIYMIVGTQLAWTLRPFFGDPSAEFMLFRHLEGSFYLNMFHTIINIFRG